MNIQVFDLDGTLADLTHRLHHIKNGNKDWDRFYSECDKDSPIQWVIDLCNSFDNVLILSGRSDSTLRKTQDWLEKYSVKHRWLKMRKGGDYTPDYKLKNIMLREFIDKEHTVDFIVDDRQSVVDMWRANGFNVLQCNAWEENK